MKNSTSTSYSIPVSIEYELIHTIFAVVFKQIWCKKKNEIVNRPVEARNWMGTC